MLPSSKLVLFRMKNTVLIATLSFLASLDGTFAADGAVVSGDPSQEYLCIVTERAGKIVATLAMDDAAKTRRTQSIIAQQYQDLQAIDQTLDQKTAAAKSLTDPAASAKALAVARSDAEAKIKLLHTEYLARLASELTPEQIDQVKDGMTYGVVPLTFGVYQRMMPDLTVEQKRQILAWLVEAREHAMDAGTSKEKHAWFGKYKGKINNYLSAAGYDLKAAEKNLTRKP
jgi:hypothetical protein